MTGIVMRLRFKDDNDNHFYRIIESNNFRAAVCYAKKVERNRECLLTDIVEISLARDFLFIAKNFFRYKNDEKIIVKYKTAYNKNKYQGEIFDTIQN